MSSIVPTGLNGLVAAIPASELAGYFRLSLRDTFLVRHRPVRDVVTIARRFNAGKREEKEKVP